MKGKETYYEQMKVSVSFKVIYLFDVLLFVAIVGGLLFLTPWDISAKLIENQDIVKEAEVPEDIDASFVSFADNFETGNMQSGAYVYWGKVKQYYTYYDNENGIGYELANLDEDRTVDLDALQEQLEFLDRPGIMVGSRNLVSVLGEDTIYYKRIDQKGYDTAPYQWRLAVMDGDGYDYQRITALLVQGEEEGLNFQDTATLAGLVLENRLVGYGGGVAWFTGESKDGWTELIRSTAEDWEVLLQFPDSEMPVMVADGRYLLLENDGRLNILDFETAERKSYPMITAQGKEEKVQAFTYECTSNALRVYQIGETVLECFEIVDGNLEGSNYFLGLYREETGEKAIGIAITTEPVDTLLWIRYEERYGWYGEETLWQEMN